MSIIPYLCTKKSPCPYTPRPGGPPPPRAAVIPATCTYRRGPRAAIRAQLLTRTQSDDQATQLADVPATGTWTHDCPITFPTRQATAAVGRISPRAPAARAPPPPPPPPHLPPP